jgi:hypothetical protein
MFYLHAAKICFKRILCHHSRTRMRRLTPLSSKKLATKRVYECVCTRSPTLCPAMLPILCQTGVGRAWYGRLAEQRETVKPCLQLHGGGHHLSPTKPCTKGDQTYLTLITLPHHHYGQIAFTLPMAPTTCVQVQHKKL